MTVSRAAAVVMARQDYDRSVRVACFCSLLSPLWVAFPSRVFNVAALVLAMEVTGVLHA